MIDNWDLKIEKFQVFVAFQLSGQDQDIACTQFINSFDI